MFGTFLLPWQLRLHGGLTARHTCGEGSTMVPVHIRVSAEGPIANRDDLTTLRTRHDPPATARFTAIRVGTLPRFRVTRDARAMHASLRGRRTTSGGGSCARGTCICTPHVESASPAAGRCHVLRIAACSWCITTATCLQRSGWRHRHAGLLARVVLRIRLDRHRFRSLLRSLEGLQPLALWSCLRVSCWSTQAIASMPYTAGS